MRSVLTVCVVSAFALSCADRAPETQQQDKLAQTMAKLAESIDNGRKNTSNDTLTSSIEQKLRGFEESVIKAQQREIDDLKLQAEDNARLLKRLEDALRGVSSSLSTIETETGKIRDLRSSDDTVKAAVEQVRTTVETLKASVGALDPSKFIEMSRDLAKMESEAIRERELHRIAEERLVEKTAAMTALNAQIADLQKKFDELEKRDITAHPAFVTLKKECDQAKGDVENLKKLVEAKNKEIEDCKSGRTPAVAGPSPKSAYEAGFRGMVASDAKFEAPLKEFIAICDLKEGEMPAPGTTLIILDDKGEYLCELKVLQPFGDKQFGGKTVGADIKNAPTKGYEVRKQKVVTAGGEK